jgi:D-hexose-6-phosphate mutarotase
LKYFDAVLKQEAVQAEDTLTFPGEIDRVYFDAAQMTVRDGRRSLAVQNIGFPDGVIWNPGAELAAQVTDIEPGGYRRCVEAAIFRAPITLEPYQTWRSGQTVTVELSQRRSSIMDQQRGDSISDNLWGEARGAMCWQQAAPHDLAAAEPGA